MVNIIISNIQEEIQIIGAKFLNGKATRDDTKNLCQLHDNKYKLELTDEHLTESLAYRELLWRLDTSVFGDKGQNYPIGYKRYCIMAEYKNTGLFVTLIKKLFSIGQDLGVITDPAFYGQPDPGYTITKDTLIHILLRHNETINSFLNPDSKGYQRSPSSFESGSFAPIMLRLFMALNALGNDDWQKTKSGKNKYVCHFIVAGKPYTIVTDGNKKIISFYPRIDDLKTNFILLKREGDEMKFTK